MEKKDFLTLCKYILVILAVPIVFKAVEILTYQNIKKMIGIYVALFWTLIIVALIYVIKMIKLFMDL